MRARNFLQVHASFYSVLENVGDKRASAYAIGMNILYIDFMLGVTNQGVMGVKI